MSSEKKADLTQDRLERVNNARSHLRELFESWKHNAPREGWRIFSKAYNENRFPVAVNLDISRQVSLEPLDLGGHDSVPISDVSACVVVLPANLDSQGLVF
jgi:hypothetical protein